MGQEETLFPQPRVEPSEAPLIVFISSVIKGMENERQRVEEAIRSLKVTHPWRFETTSASSLSVEEFYLSKVKTCDIFVLLVDKDASEPVCREYQTALENDKAILAFFRRRKRPKRVQEFVEKVRAKSKYREYATLDELASAARIAVQDEIIQGYRGHGKLTECTELEEIVLVAQPGTPIRTLGDVIGYIILGIEDTGQNAFTVDSLKLFGGEVLPRPPWKIDCPFSVRDIRFRDANEMEASLIPLVKAVQSATQAEGDPQAAFFRTLTDEIIPRISQYAVSMATGTTPAERSSASDFRYVVLGVREDYAPLFEVMRIQELLEGPAPVDVDAIPVLFRSLRGLQVWTATIQKISGNPSDKNKALEILAEAALRFAVEDFTSTPKH